MRILILSLIFTSFLPAADFGEKLKPFLDKYCVDCHGEKKQKGDFRFDTLKTELNDLHTAENWQHVLDEMNAGNMPPEDETQPSKDELSDALQVLTYEIEEAKKVLYGKDRKVVMRRLNRREYINTMYELTGIKIAESDVMGDSASTSYDTNGSGLFLSSFQFNQYRSLAKNAIGEALKLNSGIEPKKITIEPEVSANKKLERLHSGLIKSVANPNPNGRKLRQKFNKVLKEFLDGHMKNPAIEKHLCQSSRFIPNKLSKFVNNHGFRIHVGDKTFKPGLYKITFKVGLGRATESDIVIAKLYQNNHLGRILKKEVQLTNHYSKPRDIELEIYCSKPESIIFSNKIIQEKTVYGNEAPFIAIDKVIIEGPLSKKEAYTKIFPFELEAAEKWYGGREIVGIETQEEKYAYSILRTFASKAYRASKVEDEFILKLVDMFKEERAFGLELKEALVEPLSLILSSPKFIYSLEKKSDEISEEELAGRLSYFLWSNKPDKELTSLAKTGMLRDRETLSKQVQRMLNDPKSLHLAQGFIPQWLEFHKLQDVDVSKKLHKKFNSTLNRDEIKLETIHFFKTLAKENLSIANFIDSDFTVANNNLRHYYGLPLSASNEFKRVKLLKGSPRGGLIGQAAILVMTGNGERTSPVLRGAFIMDKILGMPSPEPPPNVPQLEGDQFKGLSMRAALKLHTEKPQCSSCHKRIDPLGFGLENFDAAGLWRDPKPTPTQIKRKINVAIDNDGQLPNGEKFTDIFELKKILMKYNHKFARSFTEELLSYALGREVGFADAKLVDELLGKTKSNKYPLGDLITEIVLSKEFSQKN